MYERYWFLCLMTYQSLFNDISVFIDSLMTRGGARGVIVIVVGNGHGDMSSNPGRD